MIGAKNCYMSVCFFMNICINSFAVQASNIYGSYSGRRFDYGYGYGYGGGDYGRGDYREGRVPEAGPEGTGAFGGYGYYGQGADRGS